MLYKIITQSTSFILSFTKYRFVRYVIVGGFSAILELSILIFLVEIVKMSYLVGNGISFAIVQVINYILSRKWVFQSRVNKKRIEFPVFMFFVAGAFAINQVGLWFFVSHLTIRYEISKIIAILLVVIWNFFTRRLIIFKKLIPAPENKL